MDKRILIRFLLLAVIAHAAAVSCIYPFTPILESSDNRLVVEGSIHPGAMSTFYFSYVYPLSSTAVSPGAPQVSGYIEGEDGTRVQPVETGIRQREDFQYSPQYCLRFDTSHLSDTQRYRIHFQLGGGNVFESEWATVSHAPVIDELSYIMDKTRSELNIALSMHCLGNSHFRWHYDEDWEYHADLWGLYYFDPDLFSTTTPLDALIPYENGENTYYCWRNVRSPQIKLFSTADLTEDRFVDLEFHRINSFDERLMTLYRLHVYVEALDEDTFLYWNNIQENSQNQGSIFSPTPSQMQGNIRCLTDPNIQVIGWVNASCEAEAEVYYDNGLEHFYSGRTNSNVDIKELTNPADFYYYYLHGFYPFDVIPEMMGNPPIYEWVLKSCVDCRNSGGTKNRPADWPNNHK